MRIIDSRTDKQILADRIQACANTVAAQIRHPEWARFRNYEIAGSYARLAVRLSRRIASGGEASHV